MIGRKARARARLQGAAEVTRHLPAAAALMAIKAGHGLPGAVLMFDGIAAVIIGRMDRLLDAAGSEVSPDLFDLPNWNELADMAGEEINAARLQTLIEESRIALGFQTRTFLGLASITET